MNKIQVFNGCHCCVGSLSIHFNLQITDLLWKNVDFILDFSPLILQNHNTLLSSGNDGIINLNTSWTFKKAKTLLISLSLGFH